MGGLIMASKVPRRRKRSFSWARRTDGGGVCEGPVPPFPANGSRSGETGSAALGRRLLDGRLNGAEAQRGSGRIPRTRPRAAVTHGRTRRSPLPLSHNHRDRCSESLEPAPFSQTIGCSSVRKRPGDSETDRRLASDRPGGTNTIKPTKGGRRQTLKKLK